jgi:hypothetical protein
LRHLAEADQSDSRIDNLDSPVLDRQVHRVAKKLFPSHNPVADSRHFLRAFTFSLFVLQNVALNFSDGNPSQRSQAEKQGGIA